MRAVAPKLYERVSFSRNQGRVLLVSRKIISRYGLKVLGGPFKGLKYVSTSAGSVFAPKLVGSYESELQTVIRDVISNQFRTLVDIGCAEGYYAVGLLVAMPKAHCIAFDMDANARKMCTEMAALNGVADRLNILEKCERQALNSLDLDGAFILCDCEGAEFELLDPVLVPQFQSCDILVEIHECFRPGVAKTLCERFAATHLISLIDVSKRDPLRYPCLSFLGKKDRALAVEEFRPAGMLWAIMRPLSKVSSKPQPEI